MINYIVNLNVQLEDVNISELHINNLDVSGFFTGNLNIANLYNTYETSSNIIANSLNINNNFKIDSNGTINIGNTNNFKVDIEGNIYGNQLNSNNNFTVDQGGNVNFSGTLNATNTNQFYVDVSSNIYGNDIYTSNKNTSNGLVNASCNNQSLNQYLYAYPQNASQEIINNLINIPEHIFNTVGITAPDLSFNIVDLSGQSNSYIQNYVSNLTNSVIANVNKVHVIDSSNNKVIEDASGNAVKYTGAPHSYPYLTNKVYIFTGESCPFCAYERWPLIIALSRFGTFKGLLNIQSSSWDVPQWPNLQSFSFRDLKYDSSYFSIETNEYNNILGNSPCSPLPIYSLSSYQSALYNTFDTGAATPFISIGNSWIIIGAQIDPELILGLSRSRISNNFDDTTNPLTKDIISSANYITACMSVITGNKPASVCNSPGVLAAKAKLGI